MKQNGKAVLTPSRKQKPIDPIEGITAMLERAKVKCQELYENDQSIVEHCRKINFPVAGLPREARKLVAAQKAEATKASMTLEIPSFMYAAFCEAALVWGLPDWKAAIKFYLNETVTNLQNDRFFLDDIED